MKMKLTLVLLLFFSVGVLARVRIHSAEVVEASNESTGARYTRSASGESSEGASGEPLGESHGGDLEVMSNKAGMNGNGMSDENNSENSSGMKTKGGKSKESGEAGGQSNGGGSGGESGLSGIIKTLSSKVDMDSVRNMAALAGKYYYTTLPVSLEALTKTFDISNMLGKMTDKNSLYQLMKSVPLVGTIVEYMTNTLSIPIDIIAFIFALGTTMVQHVYGMLPSLS